ncbi:hypothetical protein DFH08DRAFT_947874 [Mycena albidolilacea]|uniref:Uncharacterized protein n=1 Tax=Mycena albidolilacea TaxID=1033008 RepID=A0AAD7F6Y7_9AGAR|nr:hypothetical protein DFH08DRAFT_947874 [Mycena albidolilacea]
MSFSTLPPEICGAICAEVKELRGNLAVLCTTSRNFCREAQRILYHSVDLQGREMRATKSWARAVTQYTHLAERMHALTLQLPSIESLDVSDIAKIVKVLSRCINLKELCGVPECMISACPFRLQKFENLAPFKGWWDDDFWKTQTEIRVLSLTYFPPSLENQLPVPNLIALRIAVLHNLPERPLQRVETGFHTDLTPLARYSRTLTTLNLQGEWYLSPITQILAAIAASFPSLLHLIGKTPPR